MPTFMQKIRLALRGWNRRREERDREFLARNLRGGQAIVPVQPARQAGLPVVHVDIEGIIVAYIDSSGRTTFYLDTESGDVIESNVPLDGSRYKAIPTASHDDDRIAFLATVEDSRARARLTPAESFREVLSSDRALERAWYNFRNDRALAAIERWLREHGLK